MSALFLLNAFFIVRFLFHGVLSVDDVERDPANFVAIFIRNQNGVMPVLQLWPLLKEPFGKSFRSIHCRDVVRQFRSAFINDRFGIDKIEVIEWHYFSRHTRLNFSWLDLLIDKGPLVLSLLVQFLGTAISPFQEMTCRTIEQDRVSSLRDRLALSCHDTPSFVF
jgi:hypothetical protein